MPEGLRHLGPWAVRGEPWPEGGATRPCAVRRRHGEPLKVVRIAFRAVGRKGVHRDHAYPAFGPPGEQETAALRILATSRHVPGAGGEVTVAVPLMTAPPAAGPAGLVVPVWGRWPGPWSATSMTLPVPAGARHRRAHLGARQDQPGG